MTLQCLFVISKSLLQFTTAILHLLLSVVAILGIPTFVIPLLIGLTLRGILEGQSSTPYRSFRLAEDRNGITCSD